MKVQVGPRYRPVTTEYLEYEDVMQKFDDMMEWLAGLYVNTLNAIHYMHDKYCYERIQMALHNREVKRYFATGIAGLSVVADSLSAIKYARVKPLQDENGVAVDFEIRGDFPKYGNNDDRADSIAVMVVQTFMDKIRKHSTYRHSIPTMSILTITSNVVYGKKTGNTPDGRKAGRASGPRSKSYAQTGLPRRPRIPGIRLRKFPSPMRRTAFPTHFLLFRGRSAKKTASLPVIWIWTALPAAAALPVTFQILRRSLDEKKVKEDRKEIL